MLQKGCLFLLIVMFRSSFFSIYKPVLELKEGAMPVFTQPSARFTHCSSQDTTALETHAHAQLQERSLRDRGDGSSPGGMRTWPAASMSSVSKASHWPAPSPWGPLSNRVATAQKPRWALWTLMPGKLSTGNTPYNPQASPFRRGVQSSARPWLCGDFKGHKKVHGKHMRKFW